MVFPVVMVWGRVEDPGRVVAPRFCIDRRVTVASTSRAELIIMVHMLTLKNSVSVTRTLFSIGSPKR